MSHWICSDIDATGEERELRCPKCGAPGMIFEEDISEGYWGMKDYFGLKVTCFECGHQFTVTENCWEMVCECD